jgi:ribose-phosphate pyrophosphokinase
VSHATNHISDWIKLNIENPILIGPDSESEQWVSKIAQNANIPYTILTKTRYGDHEVEVSVPQIEKHKDCLPVLVDDIISTGQTMIETIGHLKNSGMKPPICIGVHPIFSGNSFEEIKNSGVQEIISCNTIFHESNRIDISDLLRF